MNQRIAITGLGIISAIGNNQSDTLRSLLQSQSGIGEMQFLDSIHHEFPVGEVKLSDAELKKLCQIDDESIIGRTTLLGILAVREALKEAQIEQVEKHKIGLISGTTVGGMEKSEQFYLDFLQNDLHNEYINIHDCGACTEGIVEHTGNFCFCTTISTACSSAANALIMGANMLKAGYLDIVVVGGAECLSKFHLNGFNTLMILDKTPCKPFDQNRSGITLGEGAGYLVLETEEHAAKRNVKPICFVSGYGNACDAYHQTASSPDGKGALLAMQKALKMSGLDPTEIDYINAHGTGTQNNDLSEGIAVQQLFTPVPPISSTKSLTGHTTSAAGGVEIILSILAMKNQFLPQNLNYQDKIEELNFEPIKSNMLNHPIQHFLKNSFGFGGNNSSIIISNNI
ncbi:MAG: beta-ketoacyl-[acyl-carrier-protein] synthase family protein [Bacteroidales bacterium]|jgi:3-oxoacyl-[acyl-carrier-protein] synthase-1|nr:beta-ketoacyl-[acyl-carrier-protein] synthase family protein [Bacteroidales bacterium]